MITFIRSRHGALLVEILVAVFFFMLASTVILNCFYAASRESARAAAIDLAAAEAQDIADSIAVADTVPDPESFGFVDGTLEREGYTLTCEVQSDESASGTLYTVTLTACRDGDTFLTLPCARYIPKEARS